MKGKSTAKGFLFGAVISTLLTGILFLVSQTDVKSISRVNGKVVHMEYSTTFEMYLKNILFALMLIVTIYVYYKTIEAFIKEAKAKKIGVLGIDTLGIFVKKTEVMAINNDKYYSVTFDTVNEKGKRVKCTTTDAFLEEEVLALEKLKVFKVKVMSNLGTVEEDVHRLVLGGDEEIKKVAMQRRVYKCEHCGGKVSWKEKSCKQCGSVHKTDVTEEFEF